MATASDTGFIGRFDIRTVARMVIPVIGFFVLLHLISMTLPDYVVPPFPAIAESYYNLWTNKTANVMATFKRIIYGLLIGGTTGIVIGIIMGMNQVVREYSETFIKFLTGIPGLSWVLLAVLWFGDVRTRILFVLLMVIMPFYALNIADAIRGIPRDLSDMVKSYRFSKIGYVRRLIIPHIIPNILATSKTTIGYATRVVVVAELVGAATGIGKALLIAKSQFQVTEIFAWTFILVTIMLVLQGIVVIAESTLLEWQQIEGE